MSPLDPVKKASFNAKVYTVVKDNWKAAVVGIVVGAVTMYASPIAGKVAGKVVPKALEHVSDTPISDIKAHKSPFSKESVVKKPVEVNVTISAAEVKRAKILAPEWTPTGKMFCSTEPR